MLNFVTVGRNFVVDWFMQAAAEIPEISFYGAYSRTAVGGAEFASKYGGGKVFTDLDDLCRDENVDFVYIANPNKFHKDFAVKLLNAKKHVICEKPAATSEADFSEMVKTAEKNGVVLMEAMVPVHSPAVDKIKEILSTLGKIRRASFTFCQYSSRYDKFKNGIVENAFKRELQGGALMDIGIYPLEVMHCLFGSPEKILCMGDVLENSIDAHGSVIAKYDGMLCEISYSKVSDSHLLNEIQGEAGNIIIDKISRPKKITVRYRNGEVKEYVLGTEHEDLYYEIVDFVKQMQGEKTERFNEITLKTLETADIIRKNIGITFGE